MPFYEFEHPVTKEIFEEFRAMKDSDKVFIAPDGVECPRYWAKPPLLIDKNAEVWEVYREDVTKACPKFVRRRDGTRERYDRLKHC